MQPSRCRALASAPLGLEHPAPPFAAAAPTERGIYSAADRLHLTPAPRLHLLQARDRDSKWVVTSPNRKRITPRSRFKMNTAAYSKPTASSGMSGMCGIDAAAQPCECGFESRGRVKHHPPIEQAISIAQALQQTRDESTHATSVLRGAAQNGSTSF